MVKCRGIRKIGFNSDMLAGNGNLRPVGSKSPAEASTLRFANFPAGRWASIGSTL